MEQRPKVVQLPLTRAQATERMREIAKDSQRWSIVRSYAHTQEWRKLVNRRQVALCLEEGWILQDRINADQHGWWRFSVARVCAGLDVVIEVAMEDGVPNPRLVVVGISGDEIA